MGNTLILLILALLLVGACADPNSPQYRRNSMIDLANTCATCGATVGGDYFVGSNFRAIGPGNY
jgi:hypothetical protein